MSRLPDVKRDGDHGVEDDDVTPETEEPSVRWTVVQTVEKIPGVPPDALVPVRVPDGQTGAYQNQQHKDLQTHGDKDLHLMLIHNVMFQRCILSVKPKEIKLHPMSLKIIK